MGDLHDFYASTPFGIGDLLRDELTALGAESCRLTASGVHFRGSFDVALAACMQSRLANRVQKPLCVNDIDGVDALYDAASAIDWESYLGIDDSFAVRIQCAPNSALPHSHYAALKVKDAIADRFTRLRGKRPNVDVRRPTVRVNIQVRKNTAVFALELAAESLHRRGYRCDTSAAPLKENLAVAILLRSGYTPAAALAGEILIDPMCGSGTLLIEAALLATDCAPVLLKHDGHVYTQGILQRLGLSQAHARQLYEDAMTQVRTLYEAGRRRLGSRTLCWGYDIDGAAIRVAQKNAAAAGVGHFIDFNKGDALALSPPRPAADRKTNAKPGHLICNPPYGERLSDTSRLLGVYAGLGERLRQEFAGWRAHILTPCATADDAQLGFALGLRAHRAHAFYNGPIPCKLLHFALPTIQQSTPQAPSGRIAENRLALHNRLKKNFRHLTKWAQRNHVSCYRLYDSDLPQYAAAVDLYVDAQRQTHAVVQEYQAPNDVEPRLAQARLREIVIALPQVVEALDLGSIYVKQRRRQRGKEQYQRHDQSTRFFQVSEATAMFWVNFADYLDTGLFWITDQHGK